MDKNNWLFSIWLGVVVAIAVILGNFLSAKISPKPPVIEQVITAPTLYYERSAEMYFEHQLELQRQIEKAIREYHNKMLKIYEPPQDSISFNWKAVELVPIISWSDDPLPTKADTLIPGKRYH